MNVTRFIGPQVLVIELTTSITSKLKLEFN